MAATGLAIGDLPLPELATQAVSQAMQKAGLSTANSVLLILTSEFARDPVPALRAASKAANCLQVMGCSASGIFTEEDWVLDAPAAAALVLGNNMGFFPPSMKDPEQLLLTLAAPNAINLTWMSAPGIRFGGVSGDATGQGPFSVWQNSKGSVEGHCEVSLRGVKGVVAAAHGLRPLNPPARVQTAVGYDVLRFDEQSALQSLHLAYGQTSIPSHRLMAMYADSESAFLDGDYQLAALVSCNEDNGSVTLSKRVTSRQFICWAVREQQAALEDLQRTVVNLKTELASPVSFGLVFSCLGRGPYFYGGIDRDLELLKKNLPNTPLIGFYGNGEIAPSNIKQNSVSDLLQYSAVLALFSQQDAPYGTF